MSFLDSIISGAKTVGKFLTGDSIGSSLARTAITAYALNRVVSSQQKKNDVPQTRQITKTARVKITPDPEYRIPVVYGQATLTGVVTDAELDNNGATMYYCVTICERTGNTNLGQGPASVFEFIDVYWNDNKLIFQDDGVTAEGYIDRSGTINNDVSNLIKVYCYAGNSLSPVNMLGYNNIALQPAYNIMPSWSGNHQMSDLIFAIVVINYNTEKNVKGIEKIKFTIKNSMTQPGDCLYDYMTNTRYGAGIEPAEIFTQ
jgi:hypothetical protein